MTEAEKLLGIGRLIANDAWAASFQTLGQYRTALLRYMDSNNADEIDMPYSGSIERKEKK